METISGRVVKCLSNKFIVDIVCGNSLPSNSSANGSVKNSSNKAKEHDNEKTYNKFSGKTASSLKNVRNNCVICSARGKMKKDSDIVTGDFVTLDIVKDDYILKSVDERKNILIRPSVSNIDQLIIVVAPIPEVDFMLLDKLIINAHKQCLDTVICVNKNDMDANLLYNKVTQQYGKEVNNIISVSAATSDLTALMPLLTGKLSCMAGQSAVGKSSLINILAGLNRTVGALSEHNSKGKNTTTNVELIKLENETYIVDSPGFSMLDIHNIQCEELAIYYDEFMEYAKRCRFKMCSHTVEPDCALKQAVTDKLVNEERYARYCLMYAELKNAPKQYEIGNSNK